MASLYQPIVSIVLEVDRCDEAAYRKAIGEPEEVDTMMIGLVGEKKLELEIRCCVYACISKI